MLLYITHGKVSILFYNFKKKTAKKHFCFHTLSLISVTVSDACKLYFYNAFKILLYAASARAVPLLLRLFSKSSCAVKNNEHPAHILAQFELSVFVALQVSFLHELVNGRLRKIRAS